ncbi:MAG: enoyl-CoA hydratase-related protein [Saprospiraceae bacterium]
MDSILFNIENGVAKITINRPKVFNSINQPTAFRFQSYLDECATNDEVRAIYLTGTGKAFCAGQDLAEIVSPDGPELTDIVSKHYNPIILKIRQIEKPVVCAVNGVAAGAGANIALACDITIAKESATFIQAFSKIGLIPDSAGTFFLPRIIGMQRATALQMLGDKVSAKDAEAMGMIYKAVADEDFEAFTLKIANKLAKMPTKGIGLTKRLLNQSYSNNLEEQLVQEGICQTEAGFTDDYQEGVNAFLEKRKPTFTGK